MSKKPIASLSLDLDNKWAYLKTHGNSDWESFPSYLDVVVPRFLSFFEDRQLKVTVFVVGQDAVLGKNHHPLASIAKAGHEIGNHSFHHETCLHRYTPEELEREFELSESAIMDATGQQTIGFRGPGFSLTDEVLRTLVRRGYEYDCSTFPTYLGPLARAYYLLTGNFSREEKNERKEMFGSWKDGFQPNRPFHWRCGDEELLEIPVTTMPIFKVPIHASYLHYLGGSSVALAKSYFWMALKNCRLCGVQPSLLLHPLDFLGEEDDQELGFFPGMNQPAKKKINLLSDCLKMLTDQFNVVMMREHAKSQLNTPTKTRSIEMALAGLNRNLANSQ